MVDQVNGAETLKVNMLGAFSITFHQITLDEEQQRAKKLWTLLEFLLANRKRSNPQDRLAELLWGDEDIADPANALKNLVYRLRQFLAEKFDDVETQFILYERGAYSWNNHIDCELDFEIFEEAYRVVKSPHLDEEARIEQLNMAISLYSGYFLAHSAGVSWVIPLQKYYQRIYIECITMLCDILEQREQYGEIIRVCQKALFIDSFEEVLHKLIIGSLIKLGKNKDALMHYEQVNELFYSELGVRPSAEITELYRSIVKKAYAVEIDLSVIQKEVMSSDIDTGAFFCDYEVFKHIYRVIARSSMRTGEAVFFALLTLIDRRHEQPSNLKDQHWGEGMRLLEKVIGDSLRKSDIVSLYSPRQYVLILPTITYENSKMVLGRLASNYVRQSRNSSITLDVKVQPIEPVS